MGTFSDPGSSRYPGRRNVFCFVFRHLYLISLSGERIQKCPFLLSDQMRKRAGRSLASSYRQSASPYAFAKYGIYLDPRQTGALWAYCLPVTEHLWNPHRYGSSFYTFSIRNHQFRINGASSRNLRRTGTGK